MSGYRIPARVTRVSETIRRSRFTTTVGHAATVSDAHAFIASVRDEFPDATHNCWAFVAGPPGSTAQVGMSDDGEPHGTAGRPMLTALLHSGVGEVVAVCTRYYGGVKLGTGGLSRAYASGVKQAVRQLTTELKVDRTRLRLTLPYSAVDAFSRLAEELDVAVEAEDYGEMVTLECGVPEEALERFRLSVADLTGGESRILLM